LPTCECQHNVVRFARIRVELKPLEYADATGNLIDPDWLTITHNQLGIQCHGGSEGYSLEYRREDGSVITWEEFQTIDDAIKTAERWHSIAAAEWKMCMMDDCDVVRPWAIDSIH